MGDGTEALFLEYDMVSKEILDANRRRENAIQYTLAILGAGLAYGIAKPSLLVLALLPFFITAVMAYSVDAWNFISLLGGYRAGLESAINEAVGRRVLAFERVCPDLAIQGLPNKLAVGALLAVWASSIVSGIYAATLLIGKWAAILEGVALMGVMVVIVGGFRQAERTRVAAAAARFGLASDPRAKDER